MNSLPKTDSISELAEFWDTHDITEFEDELEEVREPVFVRPGKLVVQLSPSDAQALHAIAAKKQISDAELVSTWIHEHVKAS